MSCNHPACLSWGSFAGLGSNLGRVRRMAERVVNGRRTSGATPVIPTLPSARGGGYRSAKKPGWARHLGDVSSKRVRSEIERRVGTQSEIAKSKNIGRHHAPSRPVEGHTPADDPRAGTRRHAATAVHPEREFHIARPDMDHRVGGPGAWLSGLRYAVRDRCQQQGAAADVRGARRLGRRVDLDVHVARRARLPRRRKGPGEGLRDVAEALGVARFVRPAIDQGGE